MSALTRGKWELSLIFLPQATSVPSDHEALGSIQASEILSDTPKRSQTVIYLSKNYLMTHYYGKVLQGHKIYVDRLWVLGDGGELHHSAKHSPAQILYSQKDGGFTAWKSVFCYLSLVVIHIGIKKKKISIDEKEKKKHRQIL